MSEHEEKYGIIPVNSDKKNELMRQENIALDVMGEGVNLTDTAKTIIAFVRSQRHRPENQPLEDWLDAEFSLYPTAWSNEIMRRQEAEATVLGVREVLANHQELHEHLDKGKSKESWIAKKIEQGAAISGNISVGRYAAEIDTVLKNSTDDMYSCVTTLKGNISQNPRLHGFIAEQHHVNTFNIDAASKGSLYRAEVCAPAPGSPFGKNSVDIVIRDGDGKVVRRYQSKYCFNSGRTEQAFADGQYNGQSKLVPADQVGDISKGKDIIEIDGVKSKPLTYEEAQKMRVDAQLEQELKEYEWNDLNRITVTKSIARQAGIAACAGVAFQGGRIVVRRLWNSLWGKENPPVEEDIKEFFESSVNTAASAGIATAVTGGLVVAARNGWLPVLRRTPAGMIANIAYVGMEQAKVCYKWAKGEIDSVEAVDSLGKATWSAIGGIVGGAKGFAAGAALGTLLGPIGSVAGGIVGGIVGGIAGSKIGESLWNGAKKFAGVATSAVKSAYTIGKKIVSNVARFLFS